MAPLWSSQPLKSIFVVWFMLKTPLHLALLSLYYVPRRLRPVSQWSWKACFLITSSKFMLQYLAVTRSQELPQMEPGKAKERFVLAQPPPDDNFNGVLTPASIRPAPVGGIWFPDAIRAGTSEVKNKKVVLHFPGGAFVIRFDLNDIGPGISKTMTQHLKASNTFVAQYRLASGSNTRFPAALQDSVTFYNYVLSTGVEPKNIILSGDSAGGNLAIALLRYLHTSQSQLPLPGAAMAFSPWVHVTANAGEDYNRSRNSQADVLGGSILQWGADAYLPERNDLAREARPYISPLHHPFKTDIPLFVHAGMAEAFYDSVKSFAQEMTELNGEQRVRFHGTEYASHDLLLGHEPLGLTAQLATALQDAYDFFDNQVN
ncbi:hypothetical protein DL767_002182 [Monosporascus sp. MG133]|nr:hypothetical protein DL767_002182 [Monosporascus sp. MG133]